MTGRTLKQQPDGRPLEAHKGGEGSFPKPGELIEIHEAEALSKADRTVWNLLMVNAWGRIGEDVEHVISKSILRGSHESTDRVGETIQRLMTTLVILKVRRDDRETKLRVQLLGPTYEHKDKAGLLYYRFLPELRDVLLNSNHWARLRAEVMLHFTSKYSLVLYEMIQKRANLTKTFEDIPIEEMRRSLGVPKGKLERYQDLRRKVIDPAVAEVNALSDCHIKIEPKKSGRAYVAFKLYWVRKDEAGLQAAYEELQRHRAGRKARIAGKAETIKQDVGKPKEPPGRLDNMA